MKRTPSRTKRTAPVQTTRKSKTVSRCSARRYPYLAICVRNDGNTASLERGKAYRVIKPMPTDPQDRIRVIDEENEDYLYKSDWFVPINVSPSARKSVIQAISA